MDDDYADKLQKVRLMYLPGGFSAVKARELAEKVLRMFLSGYAHNLTTKEGQPYVMIDVSDFPVYIKDDQIHAWANSFGLKYLGSWSDEDGRGFFKLTLKNWQ